MEKVDGARKDIDRQWQVCSMPENRKQPLGNGQLPTRDIAGGWKVQDGLLIRPRVDKQVLIALVYIYYALDERADESPNARRLINRGCVVDRDAHQTPAR